MASSNDMGFLDHLEELRWRIIKSLLGVILGAIVIGYFIDWIMNNILFAPATQTVPPLSIINLRPYSSLKDFYEKVTAISEDDTENTKIGNNVRVGTLSDIQHHCNIGNYVNIHSNVFVGEEGKIKDFVWVFPHVVLKIFS